MLRQVKNSIRLCASCLLAACQLYAINSHAISAASLREAAIEPPLIGNFALPVSQQPGTFVGFGQNVIDKNETQFLLFADDFAGVNKHAIDLIPSTIYGISDNCSILASVPIAASYQQGPDKSAGLGDALAQIEYAYYNKSTYHFSDQATIVTNITFPTGSIYKNPTTGYGAPSFFIGTTFNRTYIKWFVFGAPGAVLTTAKNGTKFGNSYLYQFGFGRDIANINGWLLAWVADVNGVYTQRDRLFGVIQANSGGNVIYLTPSVWASTQHFLIQVGAGVPISQHLLGNQTRESYLIAANISWSIY